MQRSQAAGPIHVKSGGRKSKTIPAHISAAVFFQHGPGDLQRGGLRCKGAPFGAPFGEAPSRGFREGLKPPSPKAWKGLRGCLRGA